MILSRVAGSRSKVIAAFTICAVCGVFAMSISARSPELVQPARLLMFLALIGLTLQVFAYGRTIGYDWRAGPVFSRIEMVLRCGAMALILGFLSLCVGGLLVFFVRFAFGL